MPSLAEIKGEKRGNISFIWVQGHPERREFDKCKWSLEDIGIFLADETARIGGSSDQEIQKQLQSFDLESVNVEKFHHIAVSATDFLMSIDTS